MLRSATHASPSRQVIEDPMENIMATHHLELVHTDNLCLEPGKGNEENILVVMDHFTHYVQAYVTHSQMAQTMAKAL